MYCNLLSLSKHILVFKNVIQSGIAKNFTLVTAGTGNYVSVLANCVLRTCVTDPWHFGTGTHPDADQYLQLTDTGADPEGPKT